MSSSSPIRYPLPGPDDPRDGVGAALMDSAAHPGRNVFCAWSWKTAALSAVVRALIFLSANRHSDARHAAVTGVAEALYSLVAAGLVGALTQRLRFARPLWAAAGIVWVLMPAAMVAAELKLHRLVHTPHVRVGLAVSLAIASVSSGFTWFAMRRGVLLQGIGDDSLAHDLRALPRVLLEFVGWPVERLRRASDPS